MRTVTRVLIPPLLMVVMSASTVVVFLLAVPVMLLLGVLSLATAASFAMALFSLFGVAIGAEGAMTSLGISVAACTASLTLVSFGFYYGKAAWRWATPAQPQQHRPLRLSLAHRDARFAG